MGYMPQNNMGQMAAQAAGQTGAAYTKPAILNRQLSPEEWAQISGSMGVPDNSGFGAGAMQPTIHMGPVGGATAEMLGNASQQWTPGQTSQMQGAVQGVLGQLGGQQPQQQVPQQGKYSNNMPSSKWNNQQLQRIQQLRANPQLARNPNGKLAQAAAQANIDDGFTKQAGGYNAASGRGGMAKAQGGMVSRRGGKGLTGQA